MIKEFKGSFVDKGYKFAIIISRFNEFVSNKLLSGAIDTLLRHNAKEENIKVFWVPGAFEIPVVAEKLASGGGYDAIICLGAVIRGETPHFDYVASEVTKGIAQCAMSYKLPVIYGVITADSTEQAIERAGTKAGNKGASAASAALEMANLMKSV